MPTLDDLNRQLSVADDGTLLGAGRFMTVVSSFESWRNGVTLQHLNDITKDYHTAEDLRRSRLAQGLVDHEAMRRRAQSSLWCFAWADKNDDGKLSLEEFKQALPEKDPETAHQAKADPNNAAKKARGKREQRKKDKKRRQQDRT